MWLDFAVAVHERESSPRAECEGQAASLTEAEWHSIQGKNGRPSEGGGPETLAPRASALICGPADQIYSTLMFPSFET